MYLREHVWGRVSPIGKKNEEKKMHCVPTDPARDSCISIGKGILKRVVYGGGYAKYYMKTGSQGLKR